MEIENKSVIEELENDQYFKDWMATKTGRTGEVYKSAIKRLVKFTSKTPTELLKEKEADLELPPMKQGKIERMMKAFFEWLKEECLNSRTGKKGMAPKTAKNYVGYVADLFSSHNMRLNLDWNKDFRAVPKPINATEKISANLVEKLAYYAPSSRDKAIIWVQFQSGLNIQSVLSLNIGHIAKEIDNPPMGAVLLRNLVRQKEEVPHHSLIYKTAIKHLKIYLEERFGERWIEEVKASKNYNMPLFLGRSGARHGEGYFQKTMRKIAPLTYIANSRFEHADINPLRSHSLRASFNDQMAKAGAVRELRNFLMGHKVPFDSAYFGGEEGLRKAYVHYGLALSLS